MKRVCVVCGKEFVADNRIKTCPPPAECRRANRKNVHMILMAGYRAKNRDRIRNDAARYRAKNRDRIRNDAARYYAKNRDRIRNDAARYRAKNRDRIRNHAARYKASKRQLRKLFTAAAILSVVKNESHHE